MAENRAVVYKGPHKLAIEDIGYPEMEIKGKPVHHGVVLKVLATNICGSDLHMYRGNTDVQPGTVLGHEITGVIVEKGSDVEFLELGDVVSVPFNVACGRCRNCREGRTNFCLNTNDLKPSAAYGYAEMGPWKGGQAEYVFVPFADFNLLKFPNRDKALERILDLAMITDVFPTGMHGAVLADVGVGKTVYVSGCGPVGLCAAISSYLRGASCVIIGDTNQDRLDHARLTLGCKTINVSKHEVIKDQIAAFIGVSEVDCAIDAVGYECRGHGREANKQKSTDSLDTCIEVLRYGGSLGSIGVYMTNFMKGEDKFVKMGRYPFKFGLAWDKGLRIGMGQTPVIKFNRDLMSVILYDRVDLTQILNTTVISLDNAIEAYAKYNEGLPIKFVIDPHNVLNDFDKLQISVLSAGPGST